MRNDYFLPPGASVLTADCLAGLPVNAITQACRMSAFRRLVRWRGLAPCDTESFTARIDTRPGVFGMRLARPDDAGRKLQRAGLVPACFDLHYFPAPDEELCERLRLVAAVETQRPGYAEAVRSFPLFPALAGAFQVARLRLAAPPDGRALALCLEAPEKKRLRTLQGITLPEGGDWLVPPGGLEEDIPALDIARDWFDVLAAAITACGGEPPCLFRREAQPAREEQRDRSGRWRRVDAPGVRAVSEWLAWGDMVPPTGAAAALELRGAELKAEALPKEVAHAPCWRIHSSLAQEDAVPTFDADARPALYVLCGFLGSGKTTLLNAVIERQRARERCVGVIQNEIGATGVDERLVGEGAPVLAMDEGCVCCTISGNLRAGVRELQARANPELLILETTGLANPLNLRGELEDLRELVRLEAVITVLDAVHGEALLAESELGRDQVRGADLIVLSKGNLAGPEQRARLRARALALNPAALLHESGVEPLPPAMRSLFDSDRPPAGLLPHVPGAHINHADEGFTSVRLFLRRPLPRADLLRLARSSPGAAFRIKGMAETKEKERVVLQCVGGECELEPCPVSGGETFAMQASGFIVFIGRDLDASLLQAHWASADAVERLPGPEHQDDQSH